MSETQYLREQSDHAQAAMKSVLQDAKNDALRTIDPRIWASAHPIKTIIAATVVGFIAGDTIARPPSSEPVHSARAVNGEEAEESPKRRPPSVGRTIVKIIKRARSVIAFVEPFLQELWASHMAAAEAKAHEAPEPGHESSEKSAQPFGSEPAEGPPGP
jgi:hypothetical protein